MKSFWSILTLAAVFLCLQASPALAHPGHYHPPEEVDEFADEAFFVGVAHPFTGMDHLLTALAVGALAFALGRTRGATAFGSFTGGMIAGYATGVSGIAVPMLESGLALAVLASGLMLCFPRRAGLFAQWLALFVIGIWNGNAHGLEMLGSTYGVGLIAGTLCITLLGTGLCAGLSRFSPKMPRLAGAAVAAVGLALILTRLV